MTDLFCRYFCVILRNIWNYYIQNGDNSFSFRSFSYARAFGAILAVVPFWFMSPFAPSYAWISVIYSCRLGIASLGNPLAPSLMFRLLYEDEKATANSVITTVSMLSNAAGPRLGGYLMENVSIDLPPMICGGIYIVYGSLFYLFLRNEPFKEQKLRIRTN